MSIKISRVVFSTALLSTCLATKPCCAAPHGGPVDFDADLLRARGFPDEIATYFRDKPHFLPGVQPVLVSVNGLPPQSLELSFNEEGFPCFDDRLWTQLRIRGEHMPAGCLTPGRPSQHLQLTLDPSRSSIELLVADTALPPNHDGFDRGGQAVLLNYDVQATQSKYRSHHWNYFDARLEPGINVSGWTLRAKAYYSRYQGTSRYWNEGAYIAKAIEPLSAIFQAGRFTSNTFSWGGLPLTGVQIASDTAQSQQGASSAVATGVVQTQAIVEIRQHGQLRYRTVVPPGPFSLSSIPGVVPGIDMEVAITEESGHRQLLSIPVPPGAAYVTQVASFQFGAGRYMPDYRAGGSDRHAPIVLTMERGTPLTPRTSGSLGLLWSEGYRSAAISVNTSHPDKGRSAGVNLRASKTPSFGAGVELSANGSWALTPQIVANTSVLVRSRRFATPEQGLWRLPGVSAQRAIPSSSQRAMTSSLAWFSPGWGTYSYSLSLNQATAWLAPVRHAFTASWKMKSSTWNLTAQHDGNRWQTLFLNVDIPLGTARWQHSAQASGNYRSVTASYSNALPDSQGSYRVQATQDNAGSTRLGAYTSLNNRFARPSASFSVGRSSRSGSIHASGGMVLADRNLLFSPSPLTDTFAVMRFPELAGLRLRGPGGATVTNKHGYSLIPQLSPYQTQTAYVDGKSIPITYRVASSTVELSPARGSVIRRTVDASQVRQLILTASMADGRPAPQGSAVLDISGKLVSTVADSGNIMLTNDQIGARLQLKTSKGHLCGLDYKAPERFDPNRPYEESNATCR